MRADAPTGIVYCKHKVENAPEQHVEAAGQGDVRRGDRNGDRADEVAGFAGNNTVKAQAGDPPCTWSGTPCFSSLLKVYLGFLKVS